MATSPRLESASTPDSANAAVKLKPRLKSKMRSVVTASAPKSAIVNEIIAATKKRPCMEATKAEISISSRPYQKEEYEDTNAQQYA